MISYLLTINDVKGFIVTKTVSRRKSYLAGFKFLNQLNQTARPDKKRNIIDLMFIGNTLAFYSKSEKRRK